MENKMFMCEMVGCFDSAVYDVRFSNEVETHQVCQSCVDFWRLQEAISVEMEKING